jgi:adenine-specific DNA-methyltransferase
LSNHVDKVHDFAQNHIGKRDFLNRKYLLMTKKTMKIPERLKNERLVEYAERLSALYSNEFASKDRKPKGQFFTPKHVSTFMAGLFDIKPKDEISILDPGAGIGILSAGFCEKLLNTRRPVSLAVDAYENDTAIIPFLEKVLQECKNELERVGFKVDFNIITKDFILTNGPYLSAPGLFEKSNKKFYDFAISNPPYYKVGTNSPYSKMMAELVCGQPNIYALFMTLSASMLADDGEMVFITPRSFCSGLYYKNFRKWFLRNVRVTKIHIFESRKDIFDKDEVLQENIIIKARKNGKEGKVTITTSKDKDLNVSGEIKVDYADIISPKNGESFIRIPTSELDVRILHVIDRWPYTLKNLGMEISTGPVVDFRATEHLRQELVKGSVPLLWMHNMEKMRVRWPSKRNKKPPAIAYSEETEPLLLPVKNYVLLKRFTSKEQRKRLDAAVLKKSDFPYEAVGIENHVNYIHKPTGSLSVSEALGIAALLNTGLIDNFFRSLNGHTQVNANEIRSVPMPNLSVIRKIGELVSKSNDLPGNFDRIIGHELGIDAEIIEHLEGRYNGKNR